MSVLSKFYADQVYSPDVKGAYTDALAGVSRPPGEEQVEEAQQQASMDGATMAGDLFGRLLERQALRRQEIKDVRDTGGFEGMTKEEKRDLKQQIGKAAGEYSFGDMVEDEE